MGHKTKELLEKFESRRSGRIEIWSAVDNSARHTAHTGLQSRTETGLFYFFLYFFLAHEPALITKQIRSQSLPVELIVFMTVSGGPIDLC